jgi:hypothetical protein
MRLRYCIIPSKLPANPGGHIGQIVPYRTVTQEELTEEISRRGTTASIPDIDNAFDHLCDATGDMLARGEIVQTPLGTLYVAIKGPFDGENDLYDKDRHRLVIRFIPLRQLVSKLRNASMERCESRMVLPNPEGYIDVATGRNDGHLTPHDMVEVYGANLKFDPTDPRQGIFFCAEDKAETRVRSVAINMPAQLVLLVPDLAPGRYKLIVRNAAEKSGELREGHLGPMLRVQAAGEVAEVQDQPPER